MVDNRQPIPIMGEHDETAEQEGLESHESETNNDERQNRPFAGHYQKLQVRSESRITDGGFTQEIVDVKCPLGRNPGI